MDSRTRAQRWADLITQFSGSWAFIGWFVASSVAWVTLNSLGVNRWDPYPFLFLNWLLTVVSTFQSPLILLSQNRQNDMDRERLQLILQRLEQIERALNAVPGR